MDNKRFFYLIRRGFLFWLSRKIDYPLITPDCMQINFTFRCNLRCKMCSMYERMQSLKVQNRPYELDILTIKKVIKEAAEMGICHLIFIGGEPFLEPRLFELISFAKQCEIIGITVVTNGTLFSREIIEKLFESNLDNLSISIDSVFEETFAKIRGENVLKKIIENINLINMMKEERKRTIPSIVCVCTIMDQNLEELIDIVYLCRRLKISKIIFQPVVGDNTDQTRRDFNSSVFIPKGRFEILDKAIDSLMQYKLLNEDNFNFIANSLGHLQLIKKYFRGKLRPQQIPCYAGYNRMQIVQDGKIYFCVNQDKYEATFGEVKNDNLKELWFSNKARYYRRLIRQCDFPCLQWCSYRDEFFELLELWQKIIIFKNRKRSLDIHLSKSKNQLYGFDFCEKWHNKFPVAELSIEDHPQKIIISEPRIDELAKRVNLAGMRILELGPLEGHHSLMLNALGAKEIIAIEGRRENFLKCLIVKNAFKLDNCKFLFADINEVLGSFYTYFDLCLALGVFYHLKNPVNMVFRIAEIADKLFVWTHFATKDSPEGNFAEIKHSGKVYRGKYVGEDIYNSHAGLEKNSFWLFEADLLLLLSTAGFRDIEVIQKENHEHGPAITLLAQK